MGLFGGGKSAVSQVKLPDFYTDENFTNTQKDLYGYGKDIMGGKLPDFYSSLGKTGSSEFKGMLDLVNRDTALAVNQNLVRRGMSRSGAGLATIAKATADTSAKMNFEDYQKASTEKANLLNLGINTIGSVGDKALSFGGQKNQFGLSKAQLELQQAQAKDAAKAAQNKMWSDMISSGIGVAATIMTGGAAAPLMGASTGMLGKAAAGGSADSSGIAGFNLGGLSMPTPGSY
jgi:hypothetical protein